jgi:amino-acid N-acetyltransferase
MEQATNGLLLPRSYSNLYEMVQTFYVAEGEGHAGGSAISGTAALQVAWEGLAEVRSLAVPERLRGRGLGRALTLAVEDEALSLRVKRLFVLTYLPDFFRKLGYREVSLSELPQKIWAICFNCVHYPDCKEKALVKDF